MQTVSRASLVAKSVENWPAMQESQVQSLGREDPLEKEMATHSSILASMGSLESDTTYSLNHHVNC